MRIGIIGAGHAGWEAARAAREQGVDAVLFSAEDVLPYYRPRLVALAFGQAEFSAILIKPAEWYREQGIDLRLNTVVTAVDPPSGGVTVGNRQERFDGLLVACGAIPVQPPFMETGGDRIRPLWNYRHAVEIRNHIQSGGSLVVVGGGILGIEAALRGIDAGMRVTIVERLERLMPAQFGARASAVLSQRLRERGIAVLLGCGVSAAREEGTRVAMDLDSGGSLAADLCLVSVGARADKRLAQDCGFPVERGMVVNRCLQTPFPNCFAAGDVVQFEGITRCSMKEAGAQGRLAARNLVAQWKGQAVVPYQPETAPLMFRGKEFEIYSIGEPGGQGYEEHLLQGSAEGTIRSLILRDGIPMGVQMVGTREGFDEHASKVKASLRTAPASATRKPKGPLD